MRKINIGKAVTAVKGEKYVMLRLWDLRFYLSYKRNLLKCGSQGRKKRQLRHRIDVYTRSGGRCENCGVLLELEEMSVHHILPLRSRPELRYDVENCQCLCRDCHQKHHVEELKEAISIIDSRTAEKICSASEKEAIDRAE